MYVWYMLSGMCFQCDKRQRFPKLKTFIDKFEDISMTLDHCSSRLSLE